MLVESAAGAAERMTAETKDLAGTRVLVLEDETLVSMMVEDMLADLSCEVVGPFARLDQATEADLEPTWTLRNGDQILSACTRGDSR